MIKEGIDGTGFRNQPSGKDVNTILLTRKQVAAIFSISSSTLTNWEKSNILTPLRLGVTVRYRRSDVADLLNSNGGKSND